VIRAGRTQREFGTNCAARGTIGTKNGSVNSAGATLWPGFAFRAALAQRASLEQDCRPRTGFVATRDSPAQKTKPGSWQPG
jgi:hypothetical protein